MRRFFGVMVACLVISQSSYAAISNLNKSLLEYQTLESSTHLSDAIPQNEFIIDIRRVTKQISARDATTVFYKIVTVVPTDHVDNNEDNNQARGRRHRHQHTNEYEAELEITPSSGIGRPTVTVISVKLITRHHHECVHCHHNK